MGAVAGPALDVSATTAACRFPPRASDMCLHGGVAGARRSCQANRLDSARRMCAGLSSGRALPAQGPARDVFPHQAAVVVPEGLSCEAFLGRHVAALVGGELPEAAEPGHHELVALGEELGVGLAGPVQCEEALVPDEEQRLWRQPCAVQDQHLQRDTNIDQPLT